MPEATQQHPDPLLANYLFLRKTVGVLGILLPIVLVFGVKILSKCAIIQDSISDYYYTKLGHYMTGTLFAVAFFMFSYRGHDRKDYWAGKAASIFSLGVAFFPCSNYYPLSECKVLKLEANDTINIIHFSSATLLFLTFAFFSLILFTKGSPNPTKRKTQRNIVYRICGVIILVCILSILLYSVIPALYNKFKEYKPIFWFEFLALIAFGTSWLTKGEALLPDKKQ